MKILLDTHLLLWGMTGNAKLSDRAKAYLQDTENLCYFSAASIWEIGLKRRNHPESIPMAPEEVRQFCLSSGLYALPVARLIRYYETLGFRRLDAEKTKFVSSRVKPKYDRGCVFMFRGMESVTE